MAASAWTTTPALARDFLGDERLARLAARGDQRAFATLYGRYRPDLERYCRTILRHTADAEDAAQNAMVAAMRALEGGTTPMRVKPWLYKIAHNEAISLARRRRPSEELDERALGASAGAEDVSAIRERLGQLLVDLKALTDRQREALVLRELCGLSYTEIAQTLGSSEAAAQQTVFEARSALQAFGEGRALDCERIQRAMSECDGMRLRTRRFRAHVRGCEGCRDFEAALLARRRDLGLLFPPGAGAGGVVAALARLLTLGGGGDRLAAALSLKGAAIGAALLAGGGALVVASSDSGLSNSRHTGVRQPSAGALIASPAARGAQAPAPRRKTGGGRIAKAPAKVAPHRPGAKTVVASVTAMPTPASAPASQSSPPATGSQTPTEVASGNAPAGSTGDRTTTSGGASQPVSSAVQQTAATVNQTVDNTVTTVTNATNQVVGDVSNTIDQTTTTATNVVNQTTTTATDVINKTTGGGIHLP